MRLFPYGETIELHRREPATDGSGNRVYDAYGNLTYTDTATPFTGVAIWPESASETYQNNERTNSVYVAALPVTADVDAIDFVTWLGKDYQVQGEPERLRHPGTNTALITIRLVRVEG